MGSASPPRTTADLDDARSRRACGALLWIAVAVAVALWSAGCEETDSHAPSTSSNHGGAAGAGGSGASGGSGAAGGASSTECEDGTPLSTCTGQEATYCDHTGQLVQNCAECPYCLSGWTCDGDSGACQAPAGPIYYVSPDGSASWAECQAQATPCALATANANAQAADTIYLLAGEYTDSYIEPAANGADGAPITFAANPSDTVVLLQTDYAVRLLGSAGSERHHIRVDGIACHNPTERWAWIEFAHHCEFRNLTLSRDLNPDRYTQVEINDSHHLVFDGVDTDMGGITTSGDNASHQRDGFNVQRVTQSLWIRCRFGAASHSSFHASQPDDSVEREQNVVKDCLFDNKWRHGIELSRGWLVEGCTFAGVGHLGHENPAEPERDRLVTGLRIQNRNHICRRNVLYGCDTPLALRAFGDGGFTEDNWYYHNTVYDAAGAQTSQEHKGALVFGESADHQLRHNRLFNNIWWQGEAERLVNLYAFGSGTHPDQNVWSHNIIGDPDQPLLIRYGSTIELLSWFDANHADFVAGTNDNVDPLFSAPEAQDFTLQPGSPAIDGGTHLTVATGSASSSTTLDVASALGLFDGWGIAYPGIEPDIVRIGSEAPVSISSVDYDSSRIELSEPRSWSDGDPVYWCPDAACFAGAAPDFGAFESN